MAEENESLVSHLEELRKTLLKCLISVAVVLPLMLLIAPKVLNWVISTIVKDSNITLNYFSPVEVFLLEIKMAAILSLIVCFPYIVKQIWNFILPALYENERNFIKTITIFSSILFISGIAFCMFLILPLIIKFGMSFSTGNVTPVFGISNVVTLAMWLSLAFGVMFQFPLVAYSLIKSGLISYESIQTKRPYVIVGILILAGILTPPDIVSQVMLFTPTYLLFELGLLFSRKFR